MDLLDYFLKKEGKSNLTKSAPPALKKDLRKCLIRWVVISGIIIVVLQILFLVSYTVLKFCISESAISDIEYQSVAETSIVSTGISIVALAISVWAGLNIINSIERKELDDIQEKSKKFLDDFEEEKNTFYKKNRRWEQCYNRESIGGAKGNNFKDRKKYGRYSK